MSYIVKELYVASDGAEGLAMFKKHRPDFIVTDINMPIMDGSELCRQVRALDAHVPIIITSANCDFGHLINLGEISLVPKPLDMEIFLKTVSNICRKLFLSQGV